jgi:hypothetical protein
MEIPILRTSGEKKGKKFFIINFKSNDMEEEDSQLLKPLFDEKLSIFEGVWQGENLQGFNTITIFLDGRLKAEMAWESASQIARHAIEKGFLIFWDLNLGLFDELLQPLANQAQFSSLQLSVNHFVKTLAYEFKKHTMGVSLYRGDMHVKDLDSEYEIKENVDRLLFQQKIAVEYLSLLAAALPGWLDPYLFLDASSYQNPLKFLNPSRFEPFKVAVKGSDLPFPVLGWHKNGLNGFSAEEIFNPLEIPIIGLCLPIGMQDHLDAIEKACAQLLNDSIAFKIIPENNLTAQWDGLEMIIFDPTVLTPQGKRMLQGFCAAGGTAVSIGAPIGLSNEITFQSDLSFLPRG